MNRLAARAIGAFALPLLAACAVGEDGGGDGTSPPCYVVVFPDRGGESGGRGIRCGERARGNSALYRAVQRIE